MGHQAKQPKKILPSKAKLIARLCHDLRAPLGGIIGFTKLIYEEKAGAISPTQKEYLEDILTHSQQLLSIINGASHTEKIKTEPVNLTTLLDETKRLFHDLISTKKMNVHIQIDPRINVVTIDLPKFKQVLYNYVSNALKFTHPGGKVSIHIYPQTKDSICLEVTDTGVGIRPEDIDRLFIEFEQLDNHAHDSHEGTGLGLALTKNLVEAQGGTVSVHSTFGKGSTFIAVLPGTMP